MTTRGLLKRQLSQRTAFGLLIAASVIVVIPVLVIVLEIVLNGTGAISWDFLSQAPSQAGKAGGILPAIVGTFYLMLGTIIFALPLGVMAGIYLTEYAKDNWFTRSINLAIVNLAGVPSIVYGLFGLGVFVLLFHFGMSLLSASLTLACQALAMTVTTSREAILAVPREYREGSLAVGATKWQTIRHLVLPQALPGIITGAVLAMSRAARRHRFWWSGRPFLFRVCPSPPSTSLWLCPTICTRWRRMSRACPRARFGALPWFC
jgi:phosphate transport system permease protein